MLPIVSVPRLWPDTTIVCVGSGPSLTPDDLTYLERCRVNSHTIRVVTISDAWRAAPWADVLYAPDPKWWGWHRDEVTRGFRGRKFTLAEHDHPAPPDVAQLNYRSGTTFSTELPMIATGGHAGYQAPQVAWQLGARRIVLLGYDMQPDATGQHHFFGEHPDASHVPYDTWLSTYDTLLTELQVRGILIVNASRRTAITVIPRESLAMALSR